MRKRRIYLILVVLVMGWVLIRVFASRQPEPEYDGRPLSFWVYVLCWDGYRSGGYADETIRHMGSNAIPYLVTWIGCETRPWKWKLAAAVNPIIGRFKPSWQVDWARDEVMAVGAEKAMVALGQIAEPAVPELARLLNDPKATRSASRAARVLAALRNPGLPPLLECLTNQQSPVGVRPVDFRWTLASSIGRMGTNALPAVSALGLLLRDPDEQVRRAATNAIRSIDPEALERDGR